MNHFEEVEIGGVMCLRSKANTGRQTWIVIGIFAAILAAVVLLA